VTASNASPLLVGVASRRETLGAWAALPPAARGCDLVEARVDLFDVPEVSGWAADCARLEATGTPVLVTIRLAAEGGRWSRPDGERASLFRAALDVASWIDVEARSPLAPTMAAAAHAAGRAVVVSHHDFARTPPLDELERLVDGCRAAGADVAKLATTVVAAGDREALFELLRRRAPGLCVIGMGTDSEELRTLLPARGSLLAYAYLDAPTAPGQPSVAALDARLRAAAPGYAARRGAVDDVTV
jgi:3-dehydroquinate dehydratase-1